MKAPRNTTAYLNERVELTCGAQGRPAPTVTWFYGEDGGGGGGGRKLPKVGPQHRVHGNGSLIFRAAAKSDEGLLRCEAANGVGAAASSGWVSLVVEAKVRIMEHPDVIRRKLGSRIDLKCSATGDPPPLISWLKGGTPVRDKKEFALSPACALLTPLTRSLVLPSPHPTLAINRN